MKENFGLIALGFIVLGLIPPLAVYFDGRKLRGGEISKEKKQQWCKWLSYSVVSFGLVIIFGLVSFFI